jgi:hypothetical protein
MARPVNKQRGVFERPKGSGTWWICYFDQYGRKLREMVGFRQTAIEIYRQRKTEIRLGKFVPEDIQRRNADLAEIIDDKLTSSKLLRSYASDYQRLG